MSLAGRPIVPAKRFGVGALWGILATGLGVAAGKVSPLIRPGLDLGWDPRGEHGRRHPRP